MPRLIILFACLAICLPAWAANSDEQPSLSVEIDLTGAGFDPSQGLPISEVRPGGTADEMGIRPGDVIVSIDNAVVTGIDELRSLIESHAVGDTIAITIRRDGEVQTMSGKLIPPPSMGQIYARMTELRGKLDELERRLNDQRPTMDRALADVVEQLRELEEQIPEAAAAFKQYYPDGRFDITITIDISSDATAESPVSIDGSDPIQDVPQPPPSDMPPTIPPPRPQP